MDKYQELKNFIINLYDNTQNVDVSTSLEDSFRKKGKEDVFHELFVKMMKIEKNSTR